MSNVYAYGQTFNGEYYLKKEISKKIKERKLNSKYLNEYQPPKVKPSDHTITEAHYKFPTRTAIMSISNGGKHKFVNCIWI